MPSITYTNTGGKITYDSNDWRCGLDDSAAATTERKKPAGFAYMSQVDPLRRPGYISPSFLPTVITAGTNIGVIVGAEVYGTYAILLENSKYVHQLTTLANGVQTNDASFPHNITLGHETHTVVGNDVAQYYNNTGNVTTFFSYYDGTDWDIAAYDNVAASWTDNFLSSLANTLGASYFTGGKSVYHPIIRGDDDTLLIGDRNFVHSYDRVTNKATAERITLPKGWVVSCFALTNDRKLAIGAYWTGGVSGSTYNRGKASVWIWNYLDLDTLYQLDLNDNYVSEIKNLMGTLLAFTSGRTSTQRAGVAKLQVLEGSVFTVKETYSLGTSLPIRGAVDISGDDVYFNAAGTVYAYAKNEQGAYTLNQIVNGAGTSSGFLRFFTSSNTYHISTTTGTVQGVQYVGTGNGYNNGDSFRGMVASPHFPTRMHGQLREANITFKSATTSGRSFSLEATLDDTANLLVDGVTSVPIKLGVVNNKTNGDPMGTFSNLQPLVTWADGTGSSDCPVLETMEFVYDNISNLTVAN